MTSDQLIAKLKTTNRTSEEIDKIVAKFESSSNKRAIMAVENKSTRVKIQEFIKDHNLEQRDCRFFWWYPGLGIFVHRDLEKKIANVSFAFLNPRDTETDNFKFDVRESNYYALLNYASNKYTYEVEWKGRSEFAAYDAFVKNHSEFPTTYKDLTMGVTVFRSDSDIA